MRSYHENQHLPSGYHQHFCPPYDPRMKYEHKESVCTNRHFSAPCSSRISSCTGMAHQTFPGSMLVQLLDGFYNHQAWRNRGLYNFQDLPHLSVNPNGFLQHFSMVFPFERSWLRFPRPRNRSVHRGTLTLQATSHVTIQPRASAAMWFNENMPLLQLLLFQDIP